MMTETTTPATLAPAEDKSAWIESQRKKYEAMHEGEYDFIEFLDGEIIVRVVPDGETLPEGVEMSGTSIPHQRINRRLFMLLEKFVTENQLGELFFPPTDLVLKGRITQPDIIFISTKNADALKASSVEGKADLVVEILSKTSVRRDRVKKFTVYEQANIPHYWIVDADRKSIELYRLNSSGEYGLENTFTNLETLRCDFGDGYLLEAPLGMLFE